MLINKAVLYHSLISINFVIVVFINCLLICKYEEAIELFTRIKPKFCTKKHIISWSSLQNRMMCDFSADVTGIRLKWKIVRLKLIPIAFLVHCLINEISKQFTQLVLLNTYHLLFFYKRVFFPYLLYSRCWT